MARETVAESSVVLPTKWDRRHARHLLRITDLADKYSCKIEIEIAHKTLTIGEFFESFDAKSGMELMLMTGDGARSGQEITIRAIGSDARAAVLALARLIAGFDDYI